MAALFLAGKLLPVPHGFSVRRGGVSEGAFSSLNLGFGVGDAKDAVHENHRRLAAAAGIPVGSLCTVNQVHGDVVLEAKRSPAPGELPEVTGQADALFTREANVAVAVRTADCVPILIASPSGRAVAAVHSGWRGTVAEIVRRAVERLGAEGGGAPGELFASIGPSIQRCCYEVSDELAATFAAKFGDAVVDRAREKPHLDLPSAVERTLLSSGLRADRIEKLPHCNACEGERFFSHRRDRGVTGRHLSFAVNRF